MSLVGLGGISQSRLAIEAAVRLPNAFVNSGYFVPCAPVRSFGRAGDRKRSWIFHSSYESDRSEGAAARLPEAENAASAGSEVLAALAMKSLVRPTRAGRYYLHELIRHFVAQQLAQYPDEQATQVRHDRYYLTYFAGAEERLQSAHGQLPADRTNQLAPGDIVATPAALATRLGQLEQAQAMFGGSMEILRPLHEPRVLVQMSYLRAEVEAQVPPAHAEAIYARARAKTFETVVENLFQ